MFRAVMMAEMGKKDDKEGQVSHEIRNKWETEQMNLKKKMIVENSPEIKELITSIHGNSTNRTFYIGGVDISFVKGDSVNACAAFVVVNFPQLEVVYEDCRMIKLTAPYIPGFLAFREAYFLEEMYKTLKAIQPKLIPQVVMVDGNGILHPREFGLACHLGVLIDVPCIGVAKNLFQVDGLEKNDDHMDKVKKLSEGGETFPLIGTSGKILGKALRSCDSTVNPIYISTGHRITLDTAVELVHKCCKHRIPEPTRQADIRSREYLREHFCQDDSSQTSCKEQKKTKVKDKTCTENDCKQIDNVEELFESTCTLFDDET